MRGRRAGRRCDAGRRGPDRGECHDGDERRPRNHPSHQQNRPSGRRARACQGRNRRRPRHSRRRRYSGERQDGRGHPRFARGRSAHDSRARRKSRRPVACVDFRFVFRCVPRRGSACARCRRLDQEGRYGPPGQCGNRTPGRRGRRPPSCRNRPARALGRRGRLPGHGPQRRFPGSRGRYDHGEDGRRHRAVARLSRGETHGVYGPVPDRRRPIRGAQRGARETFPQRPGAYLGA